MSLCAGPASCIFESPHKVPARISVADYLSADPKLASPPISLLFAPKGRRGAYERRAQNPPGYKLPTQVTAERLIRRNELLDFIMQLQVIDHEYAAAARSLRHPR